MTDIFISVLLALLILVPLNLTFFVLKTKRQEDKELLEAIDREIERLTLRTLSMPDLHPSATPEAIKWRDVYPYTTYDLLGFATHEEFLESISNDAADKEDKTREAVRQGLEDSAAGRVSSKGSFAKYAETPDLEELLNQMTPENSHPEVPTSTRKTKEQQIAEHHEEYVKFKLPDVRLKRIQALLREAEDLIKEQTREIFRR